MPAVANCVPWLLLGAAFIVVGTGAAAVYLNGPITAGWRSRDGAWRADLVKALHRGSRHLATTRRLLQVFACLSGLVWWYLSSQRSDPVLNELIFVVTFGCILMPLYFAASVLGPTLRSLADRMENSATSP
jgi:hypothetical protein